MRQFIPGVPISTCSYTRTDFELEIVNPIHPCRGRPWCAVRRKILCAFQTVVCFKVAKNKRNRRTVPVQDRERCANLWKPSRCLNCLGDQFSAGQMKADSNSFIILIFFFFNDAIEQNMFSEINITFKYIIFSISLIFSII